MAAKKIAVEICKQWYLERCSAKGAGVEKSRAGGGVDCNSIVRQGTELTCKSAWWFWCVEWRSCRRRVRNRLDLMIRHSRSNTFWTVSIQSCRPASKPMSPVD